MATSTAKSELFGQWMGGSFVVADQGQSTGRRVFVHSGTGSNASGYGGDPDTPFASLAYAFSSDTVTADKGDVVYLMPGHTETVIAAGTITADIAGVRVVGLGQGNVRPVISFTTINTASLLVSADDLTLENIIFDMTGVDALANPLHIQAAGCTIRKCEFELADSSGQATSGIVTTASANDLVIEDCYFFGSGDAGTACAIDLVGGDSIVIRRNRIVGAYTTTIGGIRSATTATTNLTVEDNVIDNRTANSTKAFIAHANTTGAIRGNSFHILSGIAPVTAAAMRWGGGNKYANAVATEAAEMTTLDSSTNFIGADDNDNAAATTNVVVNKDGSILERLESIQANTLLTSYDSPRSFSVLLDATSATWNTSTSHTVATVTGECRVMVVPFIEASISGGADATVALGFTGATTAILGTTTASELDTGEFWQAPSSGPAGLNLAYLATSSIKDYFVSDDDVLCTIGTAALTTGSVRFYVAWTPLSSDGAVAAGDGT